MKKRAYVLDRFNELLKMKDFEIPPLKEGEILVKIVASGICGSDLHICRGRDPRINLPLILGHEGVGIVEEIRGDKRDISGERLTIGDFVIWDRGITCGECHFCLVKKEPSLCPARRVYGITMDGCYTDYLILLAGTKIIKIKEKVDPVLLVSSVCSGATVAHAIELSNISPGDRVVIQGPGPLGIFAVAFSLEKGASEVIVIGTNRSKKRLELCMIFGATETLSIDATPVEKRLSIIKEKTDGLGADVVIDCAGTIESIREGLKMVCPGGSYVLPGLATPLENVSVNFYEDVVKKSLRIQGVWVSDTSHLEQAVRLILSRKYPFERLVTHTFGLDEVNEALKAMENRQTIKAVLKV